MLYMLSVEYTEFAEIASTPPLGFTELPSCPICLGGSLAFLSFNSRYWIKIIFHFMFMWIANSLASW